MTASKRVVHKPKKAKSDELERMAAAARKISIAWNNEMENASAIRHALEIQRSYAIDGILYGKRIREYIILYNMTRHSCDTDPLGFQHALQHLSGAAETDIVAFGDIMKAFGNFLMNETRAAP